MIDEVHFLSCPPYTNDAKFHHLNNWSIKHTQHLATSELRSPCPNITIFQDQRDNLGKAFDTFDGIFQTEREKETFYLQGTLRRLTNDDKKHFDAAKECRIVRTLAMAMQYLNKWGEQNNIPRSSISIDEDFHYMHGRCGANEDYKDDGKQPWLDRSSFMDRDPSVPVLNQTLSMTCKDVNVEIIKTSLFQDTFKSRQNFKVMYNSSVWTGPIEEEECKKQSTHYCCTCCYEICSHFEDNHENKEVRD